MKTKALFFNTLCVVIFIRALPCFSKEKVASEQNSKTWDFKEYPDPSSRQCRTKRSLRLCDPDEILSNEEIRSVEALLLKDRKHAVQCESDDKKEVDLEVGLAIINQMHPSLLGVDNDGHQKAAEVFARSVHDSWGVGKQTICGGTGILLFLSDLDRTIYISRGQALDSILTGARLSKVINNMKPFLQEGKYARAIENSIQEIDAWLAKGEPDFWEHVSDFIVAWMGLIWVIAIFAVSWLASHKQQQRRREYAFVASRLNELDRARAEALQGQFRTVSCPICLESFSSQDGSEEKLGSDGDPVKLLRCGHIFDQMCWKEWVDTGRGNPSKCPICKQDIGTNAQTGSEVPRDELDSVPMDPPPSDESRRLRQYNDERNFRLARLAVQFPNLIQPSHVARWSQSSFDGPLAQDPDFTSHDPDRPTTTGSERAATTSAAGEERKPGNLRSRKNASAFSGGTSGGGRGGRW